MSGKPFVISVVGAGGKTSLIRHLAYEAMERGERVLVTTTTHMFAPQAFGAYSVRAARERLEREHLAVLGKKEGEKIAFPGENEILEAGERADFILIEADGSRRLPVKVPRAGEPVILPKTDEILCVQGLSALKRPLAQVCCRLDEALAILRAQGIAADEERAVSEEMIAAFSGEGYLRPLRSAYPQAKVLAVFAQADCEETKRSGERILQILGEKEGWVIGNLLQEKSATLF